MTKRCLGVVKLVMGLHYGSFKVVEFIIELHHESSEGIEVSIEALPYGLLHLYELVSGRFTRGTMLKLLTSVG